MTIDQSHRFEAGLTAYSDRRKKDGPYADDLDVDVLIVGAGFGEASPAKM